jgi:hypothetical protein
MASPNEIPFPSVSTTHDRTPIAQSTPSPQRVHTDASFDFDSTPVTKMDMSPTLVVEPGKGTGHMQQQVPFTSENIDRVAQNSELKLASPIFAHGAQYPALDEPASEDMMQGVEQTLASGSDSPGNGGGGEQSVQILVPNLETASDDLEYLKARIRIEWLGTSTFFLAHNVELQEGVSLCSCSYNISFANFSTIGLHFIC